MLTTVQANEATANNIYPPVGLSRDERLELIPIYKTEQLRISAEWRKWLVHTYLPSEVIGSDVEAMIWNKVRTDAEASVRKSREDMEANYKELVALVTIARGGHMS
jgi:hypothetical protein